MNAQEFTAKRRRTVVLPDGSEFVVRKVGVMDVLLAGGNADLTALIPKNGNSRTAHVAEFTKRAAENMARIQSDATLQRVFCEALIRRGLVEPVGLDCADLTFEECDLLAGAILKWSGFGVDEAASLAPLSATSTASSTSTPSPDAMDSAPAPSAAGDSARSPLTPPVPALDGSGSDGKLNE